MNAKDILIFKNSISQMTLAELEEEKGKLDEEVTRMILNSDLPMKIAIVEAAIKEKKDKKN